MGLEIDFLAVGKESSGGDAIAIRYGNLHGESSEQTVIVIDGGYSDSGSQLSQHIRNHFKTDTVDLVVSTHPDQDHASGLKVVLEELEVRELWMHRPWSHSTEMASLRTHSFESEKLSSRVEASLQTTSDLEAIAIAKGIPITEPFTGVATQDGAFMVLSPSEEYYASLLDEILQGQSLAHAVTSSLGKLLKKAAAKVLETLTDEVLGNDGVVSPRNNSSAICLLHVGDHYALFTGDAGIPALEHAAELLEAFGFMPGQLDFIQVPHHGSRRNVGPDILNRLLGPKGQASRVGTAFVSAPAKNPEGKHPSDKVTNAFLRRGYPVHSTQGNSLRHHRGAPARAGYSRAEPLPFIEFVEDDSQ